MVNKWHDYETGPDAPEEIYAVIENPQVQKTNTNTTKTKKA